MVTERMENASMHLKETIYTERSFADNWKGSALHSESTLHQISPYIGKIKSTMAETIIREFSGVNDTIYDPFCGAGTIPLEAWTAGRNVVATDLNPYAMVLTQAKLFPYYSSEKAMDEIQRTAAKANILSKGVDLNDTPQWVRDFFHADTLREIITWSRILTARKSYFLLACLLGILHHQRPGFLSYPSSHTVPYLRTKKFPREEFPELYEYRPLKERLERKVLRALRRVPELKEELSRTCSIGNALDYFPEKRIDVIITSPPYMRKLDYGRDNRLRLWFLGVGDWQSLNKSISPKELSFTSLMRKCLKRWHDLLSPGGTCVFVLGDSFSRNYQRTIPDMVAHIATEEVKGYSVLWSYTDSIPAARRVRRNCSGNQSETILVLKKKNCRRWSNEW